jgi:hypothetical protein
MLKNRSLMIFVTLILLLATIPTSLGATTSQYQDVKWMQYYTAQSSPIISDLNGITAAANAGDYKKLYDSASHLSIDSGKFLKKSKGFKVSPKLKNVKIEAELAATDSVTAAKYIMIAVNKQNAGDVTGRNKALKSAANYLNSGSKHTNKMIGYLNVYTGKS